MAHVLMPLPALDFDPTEAAVSWRVLTRLGHNVTFATPNGAPAQCDPLMISGRGLDPWGWIPILDRVPLVGLALRANAVARQAYAEMAQNRAYRSPVTWTSAKAADYDGILLPGGHRARGMRAYLESEPLQGLVAAFFSAEKPVAAICHGALLAARSKDSSGQSVLFGRKTTALTWRLERAGAALGRIVRFWDPNYYRTYADLPGQPHGFMSVQQEVTRVLASPSDFLDVPVDAAHHRLKVSGIARDSTDDERPAWVVRDRNYVSARWPGDAHTFARTFADLLESR